MSDSAAPAPDPAGDGGKRAHDTGRGSGPEGGHGTDRDTADAADSVGSAAEAAAAVLALWEHVEVRAAADTTPAALRVLTTVERLAPLTPAALCRVLGMTPASTSRLCGRLVTAGLLRRRPHEADGRSTVLALTPAGAQVVGARREDVLRAVATCLHETEERRQEALRAALAALGNGLRGRLRVTPAG
jgi:DNA-binding MarR family transcriptional regulator